MSLTFNLCRTIQAINHPLVALCSIYKPLFSIPQPGLHPLPSISLADVKVLVNIPDSHAPVVGHDAHQALANVADLVVVV